DVGSLAHHAVLVAARPRLHAIHAAGGATALVPWQSPACASRRAAAHDESDGLLARVAAPVPRLRAVPGSDAGRLRRLRALARTAPGGRRRSARDGRPDPRHRPPLLLRAADLLRLAFRLVADTKERRRTAPATNLEVDLEPEPQETARVAQRRETLRIVDDRQ